MSLVKGLKNIQRAAEQRSGGGANFLKLKDGESRKIRFLQELDEEADGFNEQAGVGFLAVEYRDPDNFRKRALDTSDEGDGSCWMAEQGWRPRQTLYINVLDVETGEVKVLSQGFGPKTIVNWLLEYAGDVGTITNQDFRIKRTGSGMTDTQYTLTPAGQPDKEPYDVSQHELVDLERLLNKVPYDEQEDFFRGDSSESDNSTW
jgi:hypothetical protein